MNNISEILRERKLMAGAFLKRKKNFNYTKDYRDSFKTF